MTREQNIRKLVSAVAEQYRVTEEKLKGKDRTIPLPEARAVFFYLATRDLGLSHGEAAEILNKKRCNATQQGNKIEYRSVIYSDLAYDIEQIRDRVNPEEANPYFEMYANLGKAWS